MIVLQMLLLENFNAVNEHNHVNDVVNIDHKCHVLFIIESHVYHNLVNITLGLLLCANIFFN